MFNESFFVVSMGCDPYRFSREGRVWAVIERKTMSDFVASIIDGRYVDQTARMLKSGVRHMYFLVVGLVEYPDDHTRDMIDSAIMHLQMKHSIKASKEASPL